MTLAPAASTAPAAEAAAVCRGLTRQFGATRALGGVDLEIRPGTVHALVGENGAGKSTLLGVLAGRVVPDSGTVHILGHPLPFGDPRSVRRLGVAAIYQELTMVPALSATANAFLGIEERTGPVIDERAMRERFRALCGELDVAIPPDARTDRLPVAQQQLIEIMRGLISNARLLLLDEPTTALPEHERDSLFRVVRQLRADGVTIMLVSHNLDEVLAISDTITVLRNGQLVATAPVASWTKAKLVSAMLGRSVESELFVERSPSEEIVLEATGVTVPGAIEGIDLVARRGEVLGLAGLIGSGRTTLMRALAGLEASATGSLKLEGRSVRWPRTTREALRNRIVLLPEDRRSGLVLGMPAADNVTLGDWRGVTRFGILQHRRQQEITRDLAGRFGFDPGRASERVGRLSGGNQQKVLVAKSVRRDPLVLLADEPTRGIDVGAKADVLATLGRLAAAGLTVIVASSELEEVLEVSDRVIVLHFGRAVGEIRRGEPDWSVKGVLHRAFEVGAEP
jgi:ABC-type sugar transport system ATPase subunit